jgi:Mg-chelatase subunit ChlD
MTLHASRAPDIGWLAALMLASACSTNTELDIGDGSAGRPSSHADGGTADASNGSPPARGPDASVPEGPIFHFDAGHRPGASDDAAMVCSAEAHEAQKLQLDMLVVMDGSRSMKDPVTGGRKWDLVVAALTAFTTDPASAGIGVGLTYFGIPDAGDASDPSVSCNVADYAAPAVPIAPLTSNSRAITASLSSYDPIGGTPTLPALLGAVQFAHDWLAQHADHRIVLVLATDGEPNDCDSTVDAVSAVAGAAAAAQPSISTYVIGVGPSLSNLDQIAVAGGTDHAFLVDTATGTTQSFIQAMNAIRGKATLPCHYDLPAAAPGKPLDYDRVNVALGTASDGGRNETRLLQVPDQFSCDSSGGWYYDDPKAPTSIELCSATCTTIAHDPTAGVQILVGCKTETRPVR